MFIIFGLIFNVNMKEGDRFLEQPQVESELAEAETKFKAIKDREEEIKQQLEEMKQAKGE